MSLVHVHPEGALTLFSASRTAGAADIVNAVQTHYPLCTRQSKLWDFRDVGLTTLSAEDLSTIARTVKNLPTANPSPRVALVVRDPASFVLACQYMAQATALRVAAEYRAFQCIERAREWLTGK